MLRRKRLGMIPYPRPTCSLTGAYFAGHRNQPSLSIRTYTMTMFGYSAEKIHERRRRYGYGQFRNAFERSRVTLDELGDAQVLAAQPKSTGAWFVLYRTSEPAHFGNASCRSNAACQDKQFSEMITRPSPAHCLSKCHSSPPPTRAGVRCAAKQDPFCRVG